MFKKIQTFVDKFQAVIGLIAAISAACMAFNEEMKRHYKPESNTNANIE